MHARRTTLGLASEPSKTRILHRRRAIALTSACALALSLGAAGGAQAASLSFAPQSASPLSLTGTSSSPDAIAVGDLTGTTPASDPQSIVVADSGANQIAVFIGMGNGTYASPVYIPVIDPIGVAIGDVNGDGYSDIVVASASTPALTVLLNEKNGVFPTSSANTAHWGTVTLTNGTNAIVPTGIALGDLNGDGKVDVAISDSGNDGIWTLFNTGTATTASSLFSTSGADDVFQATPVTETPEAVAVGNLSGHAKDLDIVTADAGGNVTTFTNSGSATFTAADTALPSGAAPDSVAIGALRGSSKPNDVVAADSGTSQVSVLQNNGSGTLTLSNSYGTGAYPASVALADFNGDGFADIVTANGTGASASVLLGNGDDTFGTAQTITTGIGAAPVAVAAGNLVTTSSAPGFVVANGDAGSGISDSVSVILNASAPTATPSPSSLSFSSTLNGTSSSAQTIKITNSGSAVLNLTSIAASSNFSVSPTSATVLAGASTTLSVKFSPKGSSAYGALTGTITLTDNVSSSGANVAGSTKTIALSGAAIPPAAVVSTQPASDIAYGYVTFNANVLNQGAGTFYFEYGTSPTALTNVTPTLALSSSTTSAALEASIPVDPGTVYYYQIVTKNLVGTVLGGVVEFITPPDPPVIWPVVKKEQLGTVLKHGLQVHVAEDSAATVLVRLFIPVAVAKAAHLVSHVAAGVTRVRIGARVYVKLTANKGKIVTLKLNSLTAHSLAKFPHVQFTVTGTPTANTVTGTPGQLTVSYKH